MRKKFRTEKWLGGRRIFRRINQIWQKNRIKKEKIRNVEFEIRQDSVEKDN